MTKYAEAVERNLEGLQAVSTGPCPGCAECADLFGYDDIEEYSAAYETGEICSEGGFSWDGCGVCGSGLGGTMEVWHALGSDGELLHFSDACVECVVYLANGDEPEGD